MPTVRKNSFYGLLGFIIPTLVLLAAYPVLVQQLGAGAFGIYILATSLGGALAFLDLGFSAATLKFVAEDLAKDDRQSAAEVTMTALCFYGGLGILVAAVIWYLAPGLAHLFSADGGLAGEAVWAFRLAAIQVATFFLLSVFISLFKGMQRFSLSTIVLSLLSILAYGGAMVAVLFMGAGLVDVVAISLAANLFVLLLSAVMGNSLCRAQGVLLLQARPSVWALKRMFGFGSFMAVNGLSGVLLYQVQRYLIGILIGPAAVTLFHLAMTVTSKAHAVINAITEVMFPLASAMRDRLRVRSVYIRMLLGSGGLALLVLLPLAVFAQPILALWLGVGLAEEVAPLIPVFATAYFFLALSPAPFHVVNGIGKPWLNSISYAANALLNISLIGVFAINGISIAEFTWAFCIANVINSIGYQLVVEMWVWRRGILPSTSLPAGG